jgi:arylsulfatase A-like enzyme
MRTNKMPEAHRQISTRGFTRREMLKYGLCGGLAAGLSSILHLSGCGKWKHGRKPNVILISIDTLRADHLGCYGYERPTSPNLDQFASKGILFEDVTAPSPWTLPSHGSLLTGFYPSRLGLNTEDSMLPSNMETLATLFSKHGFSTAAVVNSFYISHEYGFDRGFDKFWFVSESHQRRGAAPVIINLTKGWLDKYHNEPFFLFLHFYDVHSDYRSLPLYEREFVGSYKGVIDGSTDQLVAFRNGKLSLNNTDIKHLIDLYDAEIRQLDDQLLVLFGLFQQKGVLDETVIIITSDHGEEFLEHGGVLHGRTMYQELIHVPLVIRGPGLPQAKRIREMVSLVDVMPTLLGLVGIPNPPGLEGYDLCSLWRTPSSRLPDRLIFAEADHKNKENDIKRAVRGPRYKLHYDRLTKESHIYDLLNDPQERNNIAAKEATVFEFLLQELKKFMTKSKEGGKKVPLSPENIERLKSLGYL